jgi:hypothetical protein
MACLTGAVTREIGAGREVSRAGEPVSERHTVHRARPTSSASSASRPAPRPRLGRTYRSGLSLARSGHVRGLVNLARSGEATAPRCR